MGYRIFTETSPNAPVVTLEAGERLIYVDVIPDGTNDVSLAMVLDNLGHEQSASLDAVGGAVIPRRS